MVSVFKNKVLPFLKSIEAADIGIMLLFFVYPFVFHNRYQDMTLTRSLTFTAISVFAVAICYIVYFFNIIKSKRKHTVFSEARKFNVSGFIMLMFFVVAVISWMYSDFKKEIIWGYKGRYMGIIFVTALLLTYTFISKFYTLKNRELYIFIVGSVIVSVFTLIQAFGFDFFGFYSGYKNQVIVRASFISPFGNIDVLAGYSSFAFSLISGFYCFLKNNKRTNIFLIVSMLLLFICAVISNSDTAYLGVFAGLWLICLISLGSIERLRRFGDVCVIICIALISCFVLFHFHLIDRKMSAINELILSWFVIIPLTVVFVAIHIFLHRFVNKPELLKKLKIFFICISVFALFGIGFAVVYFTFINTTVDIGFFSKILRFNGRWGSSRGRIWKMFVTAFARFPAAQKLFGGGADCAGLMLTKYCLREVASTKIFTNSAHDEFLQYLITFGILGVVAYISLIVTSICRLVKNKENPLSYVVLVTIIAYLAQSTVNITQPIITPFIFVFLAFCNCVNERNKTIYVKKTSE